MAELDPTVAKAMDQDFLLKRERLSMIAERQASTVAFVAEQSQLGHLNGHALVTAKAAQTLNTDGIAGTRIQLAGSGSPPGFPPGAGN